VARPQKQTVDYFPHDAKASEGDTLTILQSRFGNDGYAFWFKLLEKVSSTENHVIDCRNPIKWQLLLAKTSVNEERGSAIMEMLCELEAIDAQLWRECKIIWCQNLVNNIADVYKGRNRPVPERPVSTTNNLVSGKKTPVSTSDNTQSKVKESKVNKTIYIAYPEFPNVNKMTREEHQKLIEKFGDAGAKDRIENLSLYIASKGDKYKNHYATILAWDKRDKKGGQGGAYRGHSTKIPPRDGYTKPSPDPRLDRLVEQQRAAQQVPGRDEPG